MKALIILLDGFNPSDINKLNTPFISSFRDKNKSAILKKSAPFCERSEFYSGENANITKNFFAFDYAPNKSNYKGIEKHSYFHIYRYIDLLVDKFSALKFKLDFLNKVKIKFRSFFLSKIIKNGKVYYSINHIPYKFFSSFALTEDSSPPILKFQKYKNALFNQSIINKSKVLNLFDDLTVKSEKKDYYNRLDFLKKELLINRNDVYMIANSELDYYTHNNGINQDLNYLHMINKIDETVKTLSELFLKSNNEGKIFLFSPHGMLNVDNKVDVEKIIKKHIVKSQNTYFIDSTAFRVWGSDLDHILTCLNKEKELTLHGRFVWSSDLYENNDNSKHIIWFAKTKTICFPDFFRRTMPPKGMHGYSDLKVQNGFIITNCRLSKKEYFIKEIGSIINESLN